MTARDDVRRDYIVGALREAGAMYEPDARTYLAEHEAVIRAKVRAEVAEEFAAALLAVDPVEWALAGQHAGADAAALVRRLACLSTPETPCFVCTHPRSEHGDGQLDAMCQVDQCFCRTWHKDAASVARLLNAKEPK